MLNNLQYTLEDNQQVKLSLFYLQIFFRDNFKKRYIAYWILAKIHGRKQPKRQKQQQKRFCRVMPNYIDLDLTDLEVNNEFFAENCFEFSKRLVYRFYWNFDT